MCVIQGDGNPLAKSKYEGKLSEGEQESHAPFCPDRDSDGVIKLLRD